MDNSALTKFVLFFKALYRILKFLRLGINDYTQLHSELVASNINSSDIFNHLLKTLAMLQLLLLY